MANASLPALRDPVVRSCMRTGTWVTRSPLPTGDEQGLDGVPQILHGVLLGEQGHCPAVEVAET